MIARFRLPVNKDKAYELLLAAVIAEVQFRHRKFVYNEFIDDQLRQIAKWLTAGSSKFGMVLCGGCGNGKTTMLKALRNLISRLQIRRPTADPGSSYGACYGLTIVDALQIAQLCKTNHTKYLELVQDDMLAIDDLGTELSNAFTVSQLFLCVNERILREKSTIISTNLNLVELRDLYSERTFSRISNNYNIIKLFGDDIRIQKRKLHQ